MSLDFWRLPVAESCYNWISMPMPFYALRITKLCGQTESVEIWEEVQRSALLPSSDWIRARKRRRDLEVEWRLP